MGGVKTISPQATRVNNPVLVLSAHGPSSVEDISCRRSQRLWWCSAYSINGKRDDGGWAHDCLTEQDFCSDSTADSAVQLFLIDDLSIGTSLETQNPVEYAVGRQLENLQDGNLQIVVTNKQF